jgi:hypothetical protein
MFKGIYARNELKHIESRVEDPGYLSRNPEADFYPSRIQKQKRREKKLDVFPFFVITNFTK